LTVFRLPLQAVAAPKVAAAAAAAHDEAAGSENPWTSAKERRLHRRKVQPARRPVAKHGRAADAGSDEGGGSRKEKSRRLSDIGTDLAPLFRNDRWVHNTSLGIMQCDFVLPCCSFAALEYCWLHSKGACMILINVTPCT